MKLAPLLFSLVGLPACSFPDYDASPPPSTASAGSGGSGASAEPSCDDSKRNGDETGIDCGMAACGKPCPPNQGCGTVIDCDGGACLGQICQAPRCDDGLTNADESDQDCGGQQGCARCTVNQHCNGVTDCDGGACASGLCRAPTCKDQLPNGNETDLDCGGDSCAPCGVDQTCKATTDCDALACSKGKCQPAACDDQVLNQDETDLDCGGSCAGGCDDDKRCKLATDCKSGVCPGTKKCAAASCSDGVLNGDEPTADCGGSCADKCALLDACVVGADCATTSCQDKRCVPTSPTGQLLSRLKWTATSSHKATNSTAGEALDGDSNSYWTSGRAQAPALWFEVDMQAEQVFFSIEIDCIKQPNDFPIGMDIELSNDGQYSGAPAKPNYSTASGTTSIIFSKPQVARYIRFTLTQGKSFWWSIDELRVKQ